MPQFKTLPMPADGRAPDGYTKCTKANCMTIDGGDHCHETQVGGIARMGCGVRVDLRSDLNIQCSAFILCVDLPPERIVNAWRKLTADPETDPQYKKILAVAVAYLRDDQIMVRE